MHGVSFLVFGDHFTSCVAAELPSPMADRTLKLVTKTIQNLANLVEFKAKESFMLYLNAFIKTYQPKMRTFVNNVSVSGGRVGGCVGGHVMCTCRCMSWYMHVCTCTCWETP